MPECNNCGNKTAFVHEIRGTARREYDEETGEFLAGELDDEETVDVWCAECQSPDVEFDA